jgi:membrane protease YdiL (CAAX protease family)
MKSRRLEINNAGCITVSVAELLILSVVLWIGKLRGWSLKTFGSEVSWKGTGAGMLLFIAAQLGMAGVGIGAQMLHPEQVRVSVGHLAVPLVLLLSIVNPIFEEVLEVGYFIHSFRRFGRWPAVLASALFRASLHWWLGVNGVLAILALGVLLGFAYWRWRQLWPLVVAHWLCDMLGGIMGWA